MAKIKVNDLKVLIKSILQKYGLSNDHAEKVTDVYMRATYRGIKHHDVYDLQWRINMLKNKEVNPTPNIHKISGFSAIECYDGDNALGEVCSYFITERSMEIAEQFGIGFCSIRNSNHFLSAAPYVEMANEKKFLTFIMSKTPVSMSLSGANKGVIGNSPLGYATQAGDNQVLFDICLAYSSFGKMKEKMNKGENVPEYWGRDKDGNPTDKPAEIFESGLYMPIGEHKGFGLAMLVELLSSVIGNGRIINQDESETGLKGAYAQTAISIDISKLMDFNEYSKRNENMIEILQNLYPKIYIPGQGSEKAKKKIIAQGYFEIDDVVLEQLQNSLE